MGCGCAKNKAVKDKYNKDKPYHSRYAFLTPAQIRERDRQNNKDNNGDQNNQPKSG